jgi:hypothetical protein
MNVKERQELAKKVELAKIQIAELRKQQVELEQEKTELEELKGKQEDWLRGRKEVGESLEKACAVLEREEGEAVRLSEVIKTTREKLSALLGEVRGVREDKWSPDTLKQDLDKALLIVNKGREELSRAKGRISALDSEKASAEIPAPNEREYPDIARNVCCLSYKDILRIGFWLALPLVLMLLLIGFVIHSG